MIRRLVWLAVRRLAASLPCIAIIFVVLFFMLELAPGDAVDALLAQMGTSDDRLAATLRDQYGLGNSQSVRLLAYIVRLVHFDLGMSVQYGQPVVDVILSRLPTTLVLMSSALLIAFSMGSVVGIVAARRVNRWPDILISTLGLVFYATPSFWVGLMGILLFSVKLGLLPSGGFKDVSADHTGLGAVVDIALHLILPVMTLALIYFAIYLRIMRASMLEVMSLDFIRTARAKGVRETGVLVRHALRNALLPLVTVLGLQVGGMLGGAVVIEGIFSLPGLGGLALDSVVGRDLNMLLGIVVMSSILVVIVNFVVDLLYARLDPRILADH
jgi:peptide/nickel transport system permease protein